MDFSQNCQGEWSINRSGIRLVNSITDSSSYLNGFVEQAYHRVWLHGHLSAVASADCSSPTSSKLCKSLAPRSQSSHAHLCLRRRSSPWTEVFTLLRNFEPNIWVLVAVRGCHYYLRTYLVYCRRAWSRCQALRVPWLRRSTFAPTQMWSIA